MKQEITTVGTLKLKLPHGLFLSNDSLETVRVKLNVFNRELAGFLGIQADNISVELDAAYTSTSDLLDAQEAFAQFGIPAEVIGKTVVMSLATLQKTVEAKVLDWSLARTFYVKLEIEPVEVEPGHTVTEIHRFLPTSLGGTPMCDRISDHWSFGSSKEKKRSGGRWDIANVEFK